MASRLNPYLSFAGQARAALEFYGEVFGGTPTINTFGDFGAPGFPPDQVMHGQLETPGGFTIMASDGASEEEMSAAGATVSISLSGDDDEDLRRYWDQLSESGTVTMPLEKQPWGDEFGQCVDRFGLRWLVNITSQ
jgi:PhnB protein